MRRREFIVGLGAAAWPLSARAQQPTVPVMGYLGAQSADDDYKNITVPFLQGLREIGYVEGQNVGIEYRWAENRYERLPTLAADLVRRRIAVIFASGTPATWRRRQRPQPYPSSSARGATQSHWVVSPASTGREGTSPAAPS
jgi:putative ABC transport system substrate-binding protein